MWHEHRALKHDEPDTNVRVFGPDCPETIRHRMFRDWLRVRDIHDRMFRHHGLR